MVRERPGRSREEREAEDEALSVFRPPLPPGKGWGEGQKRTTGIEAGRALVRLPLRQAQGERRDHAALEEVRASGPLSSLAIVLVPRPLVEQLQRPADEGVTTKHDRHRRRHGRFDDLA